MTTPDFWKQLFIHLILPFEIEDVAEITSNCGSTSIDMNDGTAYYIVIGQAETIEEK